MIKKNNLIAIFYLVTLCVSCKAQSKKINDCAEKIKSARKLVNANSSKTEMDSIINILNQCMQCKSIRKDVVDFKISLLVSMGRFTEGIYFIDSLTEADFKYNYKKEFLSKALQALEFAAQNDTAKRNFVYHETVDCIEQYIKKAPRLNDDEFSEVYIDLFSVKQKYLSSDQINREVEDLKSKYPEKKLFLNFLKKD